MWEATNLSEIRTKFTNPDHPYGTVVNNDTDFTTIIKATATNPLLTSTESVSCDLILEKTLSSNDATLDDIITSNIEAYDYKNTVEILELDSKDKERLLNLTPSNYIGLSIDIVNNN